MLFRSILAKLCEKIIKDDKKEEIETKVVHLSNEMLSTPEIAVGLTQKEAIRMYEYALNIFNCAKKAVIENDMKAAAEGKSISKTLDIFNDEINAFLTKLSAKSISARSLRIIHNISTAVEEINQIGDRSVKLIKTKNKMNDKNIIFSSDASEELNNIIKLVEEFCHQVEKLYISGNKLKEINLFAENEERIDQIRKTYKKNHLKRLDAGICSLPAGLAFIDLLNTLEKIADNTYAIAQLIADENL